MHSVFLPHYLTNRTTFEGKKILQIKSVCYCLYNFVSNTSYSKKNSNRYYHKCHPYRSALGPPSPLIPWVPGLFPRVKRPRRRVDHPTPSNTKVKETVELYLFSPFGPSRLVQRRTYPYLFLYNIYIVVH
jgi:hypothetical protein